jgi:phosphatidyl-myo-inositol dimannoside synthase
MHLLVVAPDLGLEPGPSYRPGGLQTMGRLIVRALASLPEVTALTVWSLSDDPDVTTAVLPQLLQAHRRSGLTLSVRGFGGRRARLAWALAIGGRRFDHVMFLHVGVARLARLLFGKRFSLWLVGIDVWGRLRGGRRRAVRRANPLLSISRFTATEMQRANPGLPQAEAVHLALEPDDAWHGTAQPAEPPPPSRRAPIALLVSRLDARERYKGCDVVLDAWLHVVRATPAARLWIVGDGDDRARLETAARAAPAATGVEFRGRLGHTELMEAYRRARVFVLPSTQEGFGLVHVEAMRAGVPCICSHDAASEIVVDGETGFVVPAAAPAVATALTRLLGDDALADRMGAAGRRRMSEQFTFAAFVGRVGAVLRRHAVFV